MVLEDYTEKRDFGRTPEPEPGARPSAGALTFVVQEHAARRLHYDFRLEVDGVLKSWPVPKGPSLDPEEKRLAVMVEDHPLDYATFEGVIPKGSYGAGQVIVWDAGIYSPDEDGRLSFADRDEAQERMRGGLEAGKLSFTLRGRKLKGSWTLVRTTRSPNDWLLIKHSDEHSDASRDILQEERSVLSGLTIADLKAGRLPDPARGHIAGGESPQAGREAPFPSKLKPMMVRLADEPFSHPDWLFEPKLDGFRALAFVRHGQVSLLSRTGNELSKHFPEVVDELSVQPERELVLDGELAALTEDGLPDFALIQQRLGLPKQVKLTPPEGQAKIVYYPFDLLYANGRDLQRLPLYDRKRILSQAVLPGDAVQVVEYVESDGESFFRGAVQMGLEGMVAKRWESSYEAGVRSPSWLKIKHVRSQEFVVGGYTKGAGARSSTFGALLLGYHDGSELRYAGRVGSGFDQSMLDQVLESLDGLRAASSPFDEHPDVDEGDTTWVRPELVAEVKFSEWTHEARLRAPVFLKLRPEVSPRAVVREDTDNGVPSTRGKAEVSDGVDEVLEQLSGNEEALILDVGGDRISLTNLNKELWPEHAERGSVTKRDMIRYYARMGPVIIPHLRDRPLTLTRYPTAYSVRAFTRNGGSKERPSPSRPSGFSPRTTRETSSTSW